MGLKGFERRIERMVEGAFSRAFRSGLQPIELGRRVGRVLDDQRTVDVRGRTIAPNELRFRLSPEDHERFDSIHDALTREIAEVAREHARDRDYQFMGPVRVELVEDVRLRTGRFETEGHFIETETGLEPGALVFPGGERIPLTAEALVMGRMSDCDLVFDDPNVSRRHAEIRPVDDGYLICDLGSTNGTVLNGATMVVATRLENGDQISIGGHQFTYEVG